MRRPVLMILGLLVLVMSGTAALSLLGPGPDPEHEAPAAIVEDLEAIEDDPLLARPGESEAELEARRTAHREMLDRDFPMHGLVTGAQIVVRSEPSAESLVVGWLRLGGRVRLRAEPERAAGCASGWYELYPRGHVCAGQGVEVGEEPPEAPAAEQAADTEAPLPYRYLVVREPQVPEYHRLPSRDEQRAALAHAARYVELLNGGQERRARALRAGELAGEPRSPAVVARYLERGFYVAGAAVEVRAFRNFVRTVRGTYIKEAQLIERTGADFRGVWLDEETTLPVAWARRAARPLVRRERDGVIRFTADDEVEAWERQAVVPWLRRERHGTDIYHVLEGDRFLRAWFVSVAERIDRPTGIAEGEPWVHVSVGEQTLVLYRGDTPVYATLVSSGLDEHETPAGEFAIRRKFVSDTMANLGPDAGDDSYRIEDVPWTQYFEGSFALHGAFWHNRFGLQRSHGCVNLAPADARVVFEHTWPSIPDGWHGVSTERTGFRGSRVIVTP